MKVFKEEQRFTQSWLIVIVIISALVPVGVIINEYSKSNTNMSFTVLLLTTLSIIFFSGLIFFFKLKTRIDEIGIHYQFSPFHFSLRTIKWNEIQKAYVRNYDPIGEYGGWGLKGGWSKSKGKAINVSGDIGLQLELKNGKKLLIGSQKENELKQVISNYKSTLNNE